MDILKKTVLACWEKDNAPRFTLGAIITLIGAFFLMLNLLYPVYLDDWHYSFNLVEGGRIDSLWAILKSQYVHYFDWGGRSVLHTIAQILLWMGKPWSDIFNTLAYISLVSIIYLISNKGNKTNSILFIYINVFIWFTLPSLSQNLIWTTGSANYLWGGLLVFWFLYYYVSYYLNNKVNSSGYKTIGISILGVFAGWTNENVGVALIFFLIGLLILLRYQKKKIPVWMIAGLIGAIVGCAVMILAPGNAIRSKNDLWVAHQLTETDLSFYFYRFVTVLKLTYQHLLIPCIIYLALLIVYWKKAKTEQKKEKLLLSLLFLATAAVATIVMSGSPMFPERAWFGIIILLITGAMILYANIDLSDVKLVSINGIVFIVILAIYIFSCKVSYEELEKFSDVCEHREKIIEAEKNKGIQDIVVADSEFKEKDSPFVVLDLHDWMMIDPGWDKRVGRYYGVNTVVFRNKDKNE